MSHVITASSDGVQADSTTPARVTSALGLMAAAAQLPPDHAGLRAAAEALRNAGLLIDPQTARDIADTAQPLQVFRAQHDSITIGHYSTLAAAQTACTAHLLRSDPGVADVDWIGEEDLEDGNPIELVITRGDGNEVPTSFMVTPITVEHTFVDGDE